jgi:hypothetical protein
MAKKKKIKSNKGKTQEKVYLPIPFERYKSSIKKLTPIQRKYAYKEYEKRKKKVVEQEAKISLPGGKRLKYKLEEVERRERPSSRIKESVSRGISKLTRREGTKKIKRREAAVKGLLIAIGVAPQGRYAGAGRPRGTYKYGMPIHIYKRRMAEKRALLQRYQQEKQMRLAGQGFTPEQVQQLQRMKTLQELQQGQMPMQVPEEYIEQRQPYQQEQYSQQIQQYPPQQIQQQRQIQQHDNIRVPQSPADDELEFAKWRARTTISPNTQRMLDHLRRVQLKSQMDEVNMQRRINERRIVAEAGNLLKTRNLFGPDSNKLNILEVEGNILTAPSVFKENGEFILRRKSPFTLLDTKNSGNNLKFF